MRVAAHGGPRVGPGYGDRHEEGRDQEEGGGGAVVRHCECCRFNHASRQILCRRIELELYMLLLLGWLGVAKSMLRAFL